MLFKFLESRVKSDEDRKILDLIKSLYHQQISIGENKFKATKGTQQGSVLSPSLFNPYLDSVIQENEVLNKLAE